MGGSEREGASYRSFFWKKYSSWYIRSFPVKNSKVFFDLFIFIFLLAGNQCTFLQTRKKVRFRSQEQINTRWELENSFFLLLLPIRRWKKPLFPRSVILAAKDEKRRKKWAIAITIREARVSSKLEFRPSDVFWKGRRRWLKWNGGRGEDGWGDFNCQTHRSPHSQESYSESALFVIPNCPYIF